MIKIQGRLIGKRFSTNHKKVIGKVVHVLSDKKRECPAENAYIYIDVSSHKRNARARYISWINLYDIENAAKRDGGRWKTVEPHVRFNQKAAWFPYGWGEGPLPSVADIKK